MSKVTILTVKDSKLSVQSCHYRLLAEQMLKPGKGKWLDAGYILIDHDRKLIINCQDAVRPIILQGFTILKM